MSVLNLTKLVEYAGETKQFLAPQLGCQSRGDSVVKIFRLRNAQKAGGKIAGLTVRRNKNEACR